MECSRICWRDRVGKKPYQVEFFIYIFLVNVQCCVRVGASNFQVLTRKSGFVTRAFGNIVRFLAGPARVVYSYCIHWLISGIYTKYLDTTHIIPVWVGEIGSANTAVPSVSNIMHIVLSINADLRPVPANITCRRPDSLLPQNLQAYWSATGGHASLCSIYLLPMLLSRHDNAFHFSTNNEIIMINQSTFTFLI